MTLEQYKQLKQNAATEGLGTGLLWVLSFVCFVGQFTVPLLSLVGMATALLSAVIVVVRLNKWRAKNSGDMPFGKAFSYALSVYLYASLIMVFGQWVYFQFIDNGYFMGKYAEVINSPEFKAMMSSVSGYESEDMKLALDQMKEMRPIDMAFQFLTTSILISFFLAAFTALVSYRKKQ